jgi:hypothetical protein
VPATAPEAAVQGQLDAYNARDVDRFAAFYADDVTGLRLADSAPVFLGKPALIAHYTEAFKARDVRAALINRIVIGQTVIDHERLTDSGRPSFDAAVVFRVVDGLIRNVWFVDGR